MLPHKKLPPYGRIMETVRRKNHNAKGEVWVFVGPRSWQIAKQQNFISKEVLVLPDDASPTDYQWPVTNREVCVYVTGEPDEHRLKQLARQLLISGAKIVRVMGYGSMAIFRGEGDAKR